MCLRLEIRSWIHLISTRLLKKHQSKNIKQLFNQWTWCFRPNFVKRAGNAPGKKCPIFVSQTHLGQHTSRIIWDVKTLSVALCNFERLINNAEQLLRSDADPEEVEALRKINLGVLGKYPIFFLQFCILKSSKQSYHCLAQMKRNVSNEFYKNLIEKSSFYMTRMNNLMIFLFLTPHSKCPMIKQSVQARTVTAFVKTFSYFQQFDASMVHW